MNDFFKPLQVKMRLIAFIKNCTIDYQPIGSMLSLFVINISPYNKIYFMISQKLTKWVCII